MKDTIFSVITEWDVCLWFTDSFSGAYALLHKHLSECSDRTYIDMYRVPTMNIHWVSYDGHFELVYMDQPIFNDDYELLGIEYYCILEGTCIDDIKAVDTIAQICDLSFKK